jgi:hypothetical protein
VLAHGVQCTGSAAPQLGGLASVLGWWPQAVVHFEAAVAANKQWGAPSWTARAQLGYASALARLGGTDDLRRASELVDEAAGAIARLGIAGLAGRLRTLKDHLKR